MNGLISDLVAGGTPMKVVLPLLLFTMLIVLIRTIAAAIAIVVKAMHPGESADAVTMQANRIQHRQWKAQRRDWNRRARASRRTLIRAGLRAWYRRLRTARYVDGQIMLPALVLPPEVPAPLSTPETSSLPASQHGTVQP
ncbi:hypothetical protein [Streptomyces iranensis]|uniref:Uncharacterized protein n=1 Tax=Streptomyces iranensis TaxID=576784 RepID=A0A061ACI1_9ACTN|nr:hypothetical protein [Streptomyces iranensis]MBP2068756.1 hypothetical protein [Streptomyces iranensis]CDR18111.1 predicted protein [Streptomyces iranensis]